MLEQVSNFQAVKKAPFELDVSQKKLANAESSAQSEQANALDFKTALQKSIQNPQQNTPKDSPSALAKPNKNAQNLTHQAPQKGSINPLAHKNHSKNIKHLADENALQNALQKGTPKIQNLNDSSATESFMQDFDDLNPKNSLAKNALLQEKIAPKNALASTDKPKKHANALNSISQNASKALPKDLSDEPSIESPLEAFLQNDEESTQNLRKDVSENPITTKKDLNQMARQKDEKETFLSKIMQNQKDDKNTNTTTSAQKSANAEKSAEASKLDVAKNGTQNATQKGSENGEISDVFANAQSLGQSFVASAQSPANATANTQNINPQISPNATKSLQTPLNSATTLENVTNKAKELGLNPSNLSYKDDEGQIASATKKSSKTQNPNKDLAKTDTSGIKTFFDSENAEALRPIFDMLESFEARLASKRKALQTSTSKTSIKYVQNGEDKIAVIERSKSLPKAITTQRIKNERQEKIFEQIQRDLLAGKELNLSQIEHELNALENELFDSEIQNPLKIAPKSGAKPSPTSQASNPANISTIASVGLSAKDLNGDSKNNSKHSAKDAQKDAKESKDSKNPSEGAKSINASKVDLPNPLESSVDKELNAPQFAQNELESNAQNLGEVIKAKQAQQQDSSETKTESKSEAKTLASTSASTNALKNDTRNINPKEALSSFVQQFEQEIKRFKPPMRQISMELSPKELGNIELTITQRGNNLHISVVSNPQALQLFAQNHSDLRQSLLNAGFDGVDLSFSSNGGNGQNQNNGNNSEGGEHRQNLAEPSTLDSTDSPITQMEITMPTYA